MGLEVDHIRYAHGSGHTDVCYGNDNRQIFTCGSDGYVRIWDGPDDDDSNSDFVAEQTLSVACTADHYLVATNNNYVQGYTYSDRKRDKIVFRFSAPVTHVSVSCSGKFVAACSCDMEIQVLEIRTNKITTFTGHTAPVLGVFVDPLDEYMVSSSCDGTVKIWELTFSTLVKTINDVLPVKNDFFKAVVLGRCAWKSMSGLLLAIPKALEVLVYKRNTWEEMYRLSSKNIEKDLSAVLFSPCGNYIGAASVCGEIVIWEIKHKSEVCCYKDPKKIGISGIVWHPDGSQILFCDRLGRMGTLTGISEEIGKHTAPIESKGDSENASELVDANSLFDDDDDGDNCISLDKIKSTYINHSEGDDDAEDNNSSRPGSPSGSSITIAREHSISITKAQPSFQPSSTPSNFEPRCLCYNDVGMVRYYDSDRTIDIQFHDTMFHHSLFLRSFGICTMATLSLKVLCLAVPSIDDNPSKLTCISLGSWAGNKEWTVHMSQGEDILAVAASGDWVAVATSINNVRIFSHAGTQKQVLALAGSIICMTGREHKLFIANHAGPGMLGSQNINFTIYQISGIYVRATVPVQPLPLSPKSVLKWMGFTDEGTPATYDSDGIVRILGHDSIHWMVICNTQNQRKSPSDHYFIVGLSETNQNIRCVLCRNSHYPLVINNPTVVEIPLRIPLCEMDDAKSIAEDTFWRLMFSIYTMQKTSLDANEMFNNFELPMKQAILKLFGDAANNSDDLRAVDLATFMTKKPLDIAIKYANNQGRTYLVEKLKVLKPVDWSYYYPITESLLSGTYQFSNKDNETGFVETNEINSQQDLFEESVVVGEKENQSTNVNMNDSTTAPSPSNRTGFNPFKKPGTLTTDNPKGLKYFDTLSKDSPRPNKPFNVNKPLKLKLPSNKDKNVESKSKKPTFIEWFSKRKASLIEEYPNVSSSELTKMGTKLYKEEMNLTGGENKIVEVIETDSWSESNKRSSVQEPSSNSKRFKSLDETM